MKIILSILTILFFSNIAIAQTTVIPDPNFEQLLIDKGFDVLPIDGSVPTANIDTVTFLQCGGQFISDITGIEDFIALETLELGFLNTMTSIDITQNTALTWLDCSYNALTSLDVSQNTALTTLLCENNQLDTLDFSQNILLEILSCDNNQLTSLDVTQNTLLEYLDCNSNPLATLDVTQNTALSYFDCFWNSLTNIDVSQCSSLNTLICYSNQLTSLNITQNTALTSLTCSGNLITGLNTSQNTILTTLNCSNNQISSLDLSQNTSLTTLACGSNLLTCLNVRNENNNNLNTFNATSNPNLTCIEVDNVAYSTTNFTNIDAGTSFSLGCNNSCSFKTLIPDANFEQALIDLGYDTAPIDGLIYTSNIDTITSLIVSNKNIIDLTGIEDFIALTNLKCDSNQLSSINLTQNTSLTILNCANNLISVLDLTTNTILTNLNCSNNQLSSLNIVQNNNLTFLNSSNNQLSNLNLIQNTALTELNCSNNQLTSLNTSQNILLIQLNCSNNNLNCLSVVNGNNNYFIQFIATNNPSLTCIEVDNPIYSTSNWTNIDVVASFSTNCNNSCSEQTIIPDANFEQVLINLGYDTTPIDGSVTTANIDTIAILNASNSNIVDLTGIEDFTALISLNCINNQLSNLDLTKQVALSFLNCSNNQISSLNFYQNINLSSLDCSNNQLSCLNVKNGNNINFTQFDATNNTSLNCIEVDNDSWATTNWLSIDPNSSFNTNCNNPCTKRTMIPDPNFEQELVNMGLDTLPLDGSVITANIDAILGLNINNKNISDLTGIEDFTSLTTLRCAGNQLLSLDISQNTDLTELHCNNNQLTSLNVTQNTELISLRCYSNQIINIDVTQDTALVEFLCYSNQLTTLDITQNTSLIQLNCSGNLIPNLDVSQNINLTTLSCSNNLLTSLDVTLNTGLTGLSCNNNQLANLNITQNISLQSINCSYNQLISLDLSSHYNLTSLNCSENQLTYLNVRNGNNFNFSTFRAHDNLPLTCIKVDNAVMSTNNWTAYPFTFDTGASFSTTCATVIPDVNFEQALINLGLDIGTIDGIIPTENIDTLTVLNVTNKNISDLRGIEDFIALTSLNCSNNQISSLDLTQNTVLTDFRCDSNQLSCLNVKNGNNNNFNNFSSINNIGLTCIEVDNANYSSSNWINIDVGSSFNINCNNPCFTIATTAIPDANFEQELIDLGYDSAPLNSEIPTVNIETIKYLNLANMNISDLTGIEDFISLLELTCHNNFLTNIDITQNTALTFLQCQNNQIISLDVTQNTNLEFLGCGQNQLNSLDLSQNTALDSLSCYGNQLTNLDVSQNILLNSLSCSSNLLTSLDVSQNTSLYQLDCSGNNLTCLNLKNGNNSNFSIISAGWNNLTCVEVDSPVYSMSNWNSGNFDLVTFSTDCNNSCSSFAMINFGNDTTLCTGETLLLDVTNNNATYLWQDNSTNSTFNITAPGTYWVNTTVNSITKGDTINVSYSTLPIVNLGNDTTLCQGESLNLDAGNIGSTYLWSNSTTNQTITMSSSGSYWADVTNNGCTSSDTITINYNNLFANYTFTNNGNGNFSFTNTSTGNFNQSHWAFGDGTTSLSLNPNHTFTNNGTFVVVLTILDSSNNGFCTDFFYDTITVTAVQTPLQCSSGFVIYPDTASNNVVIYNSANGSNLTYFWNFGDGNSSILQNPSHTYTTPGPFYLCLTVDDGTGCLDTYCDSIGVNGVLFNKMAGFTINVISEAIITGIDNNIDSNSELKLYPNPTSNQLTIDTKLEINEIKITDITGKIILTTKQNTKIVNVVDLSNGIYFIKLMTNEGIITKKFIKE